MAGGSSPTHEVRGGGQEELPSAQGQRVPPADAIPHPKSGGYMGTGGSREATPCSRSGEVVSEEIPLAQVKEQQLHFAGAAVKRYPTSKLRET